jgi:hypothetical protein
MVNTIFKEDHVRRGGNTLLFYMVEVNKEQTPQIYHERNFITENASLWSYLYPYCCDNKQQQ